MARKSDLEEELVKVTKEIGELTYIHYSDNEDTTENIIDDGLELSRLVEKQQLLKIKLEGKHYDK